MADLTGANWRKSSRSNGQGGNCVEVARNLPDVVGMRDSKNPAGSALAVEPQSWMAFNDAVKAGAFDLA